MKHLIVIFVALVSIVVYAQAQVHVGDILCTDNSVVSSNDFVASGRTALGVVFFVDNTQQHGWALALNDAGQGTMPWGNEGSLCYLQGYNNNPQTIYNDTIGSMRCDSITHTAQRLGWTLEQYSSAVNAAVQYGNGWYLPAIGQLIVLYGNMPEINAALDAAGGSRMNGRQYWSCTEENGGVISAWMLNFAGASIATPKGDYSNVRAIRNF